MMMSSYFGRKIGFIGGGYSLLSLVLSDLFAHEFKEIKSHDEQCDRKSMDVTEDASILQDSQAFIPSCIFAFAQVATLGHVGGASSVVAADRSQIHVTA